MESCLLLGRTTQAHACVPPRPVHGHSHIINELSDQIEGIDWPKVEESVCYCLPQPTIASSFPWSKPR